MKYDYDIIIIGAGPAGLAAAQLAVQKGARTALIENAHLGGTCTWNGCVPMQALASSAKLLRQARYLSEHGILDKALPAFSADLVMSHVRSLMTKAASWLPPDLVERQGFDFLRGSPHFTDNTTIALNGGYLTAPKFVVCTGSHPRIPDIAGLREVPCMTSETVFSITSLPPSMAIIGGGTVGVEMAQAFARLGVDVSVIELQDRILLDEDEEAARVLEGVFEQEGIKVYAGRNTVAVSHRDHTTEITFENKAFQRQSIAAKSLFIAAGREANVIGLRLHDAGVRASRDALETDDEMRTSASNVFAAGDVAGPYRFAHVAEYQARIAVENALCGTHRRVDLRSVPWNIATDPPLARFGLTEKEARREHGDIGVYRVEYRQNLRAIAELEETGFIKVICDPGGKILGAHITGARADEIIHEYVLARSAGIPLQKIQDAVHISPSYSRLIEETSVQYTVKQALRPLEAEAAKP